jgi:DNA mismatch repair protein MutS2
LEEPTVFAPKPETLEAGQSIYHKRLKKAGVIQSVDASNGRAQVLLGNVRISADIEDLEPGHEFGRDIPTIETAPESWQMNNAVPVELNLIGYRVDDAIPLIDKTMDRALVEGELTLRIVHGFGTGRLREAIRSHLKGVPFVKKVSSADPRYGGDAITLVELS